MLDINFLGYGGAWFPEAGNTSAFIKIKEEEVNIMYLFDCGETVFAKIMKDRILDDVDEINVLLTHFHSDHIGSLASLITYAYFATNMDINIYNPKIKQLEKILKYQGVYTNFYNSIEHISDLNNDQIKVIDVIEVYHTPEVDAYSYVFQDNLNNIYIYTGDIKDINSALMKYIQHPNMKYLFIDVNVKGDSPVHLHLSDLLSKLDSSLYKYIYCMHFNSFDEISIVKQYGLHSASDYVYGEEEFNEKNR